MRENKRYQGAKIPSKDNHIRVCRTVCDICDAGCNIDAYVDHGTVIKVMGCKNPAYGNGYLCARGHANRQYVYHEDRIKTPLRRKGPRGEGHFEPITWEEALDEIEKRLGICKKKYSANSVVFTGGYNEWTRAALQRLAYSFGSVNYGSAYCTKKCGAVIASGVAAGCTCHPDIHHSGVVLMWGCNIYNKGNTVVDPALTQKRGAKVIAIDPRTTFSTYHLADLHLQIRPGTDAALAHGLARLFIEKGWVNKNYVNQHVQGFFEYRAYINDYTPEYVEQLTGISAAQLETAAHMIMQNGPMSVMIADGAFAQMPNGVQTRRAIEALCAITGNYDVRGGMLPDVQRSACKQVLEEFVAEIGHHTRTLPIGAQKYPAFARFSDQCQLTDLVRQLRCATPYPVRALCSFGLNIYDFTNDSSWTDALQNLDFFVNVDLFMTRTAKYADIVLPACSSFEREMIHITPEQKIYYTAPIIAPLGEARADLDIICDLARRIAPEDFRLCSGAQYLYDYWLLNMNFSLDVLKQSAVPTHLPRELYRPGDYTKKGYKTPSGRYELKSQTMAQLGQAMLPEYKEPRSEETKREFPFVLSVGNRQTFGFHSRTHRIEWIRAMQVAPAVEMHPDDAAQLDIKQGDTVEIKTEFGAVQMLAQLTRGIQPGMVAVLPNYEEADICAILPEEHVDPCSGVSALRIMSCDMRKV